MVPEPAGLAQAKPAAPLAANTLASFSPESIGDHWDRACRLGGTEAIREVLVRTPENSPGIVIVQNIRPVFSATFANRLNDLCRIRLREAADGDRIMPGLALVAPGNFHMTLQKRGGSYSVAVHDGERVCY